MEEGAAGAGWDGALDGGVCDGDDAVFNDRVEVSLALSFRREGEYFRCLWEVDRDARDSQFSEIRLRRMQARQA